jgi:diguanylate cyclase (GGDEF)-like protein
MAISSGMREQLELCSPAGEAERLVVLQRTGLLDSSPEFEFDRWTATLREDTGAAVVAFLLNDATRVFFKSVATVSGAAPEGAEIPLLTPFADYLIGRADLPRSAGGLPVHAQAPVSAEGQILGWLTIVDHAPRKWGQAQLRALENAAAAVSTQVRLRLADREAARVHHLVASHNRVHEMIAKGAPLEAVLAELAQGIERYDASVMACVVLLNRETSTLHPGAGPSLPPEWLAAIDGVVIGPNIGTCGAAAWSGNLTITEDMGKDPKWAPVRDFAASVDLHHCWSMPIKTSDDEVLGTLALYGRRPRRPLAEHITLMEDGARLAGIAIERHRTMERLVHEARHDGLTGLANRTAIFEHLDDAIVRTPPATEVAVLFVDLDGLKRLNDTLGHERADEMIREVGERLSGAVHDEDFVGRFGGDEFVVIAEGVTDHEQAAELGFRLLDAIAQPLPGIESIVVTASIGIALTSGTAADAREAIREADSAMYTAKRSGRDRCSFYEGRERLRTGRRLSIARALRDAEMRGEMRLVFQPVFELERTALVAVEALLRWDSPTLGEVSPVEFIPIAEDSGVIVPLGAWVLRESCEILERIVARVGRPLELSVNVSAHQLAQPGFAQTVRQTLHHARFAATSLTLELTETALLRPDAVTLRTLAELKSLGVGIALDDFGAGYSSLAWLREHPLDAIKIDRSFVSGLPGGVADQAMIGAMVGVASAIGCVVTAEGVETAKQLQAVKKIGCVRAQGFLLARPMRAHELAALLLTA